MLAIAAVACLCVVALIATILWLSFTDGTPGDPQLGYTVAHYVDVLTDRFTWRVLGNTLVFLAVMAVFGLERAPFDISTIFGMGVVEGPEPHADHIHHDRGRVAVHGPGAGGGRRHERRTPLAGGAARDPAGAVAGAGRRRDLRRGHPPRP